MDRASGGSGSSQAAPRAGAQARVPLRPLGAAELLDSAVRVVRRNARAVFAFAVPLAALQAVLHAVLLLGGHGSAGIVASLPSLLVTSTLATLLAGLLAPVVMADVLGGSIDGRTALRGCRGTRGVLALLVLGLGVAVGQDLGLVLAVVGGVWLWVSWAVAGPAMALERLGPFAAVRRSFRLVRHRFWQTLGVRSLGWLLTSVLALLITLPAAALAAGLTGTGVLQTSDIAHANLYVTIIAVGQLLSVSLTAPITAVIDSLIYTDLRMRVEGLDIVLGLPTQPVRSSLPAPSAARPAVTAW